MKLIYISISISLALAIAYIWTEFASNSAQAKNVMDVNHCEKSVAGSDLWTFCQAMKELQK